MVAAALILVVVTIQRLAELLWAARNTDALLARGGYEVAPGQHAVIVVFHALWLTGLWLLAWTGEIRWGWLALFLLCQAARLWVLATLGRRWTTRIIVLPGETLVRRGPYRFLRHPNYAVVLLEILALPMVFGLAGFALVFSLLNAALLAWRIATENAALARAGR
jgi:methyltransferase